MRLVYIDEAGISNPKQEPFLVVAGVIIHADKNLIAIERYLDKLVDRYIPQEARDNFVFHATHLFNWGGPVFKKDDSRFPISLRHEIADNLAAIPSKFGLNVAIGFVERARVAAKAAPLLEGLSEKEKNVVPHVVAFMTCAIHVEHWMRQNARDEVCMLVIEDNDQARRFIKEAQAHFQNPNIGAMLEGEAKNKKHFPLRMIKEDPLFQNKKKSSVLQLADFFAYVFKRKLMGDTRYDRFIKPLNGHMAYLAGERSF